MGHSRDRRPDSKHVVVGLGVNRGGFLLAQEVFEGNTQHRKTLGIMLNLLNNRVGLSVVQTVVED